MKNKSPPISDAKIRDCVINERNAPLRICEKNLLVCLNFIKQYNGCLKQEVVVVQELVQSTEKEFRAATKIK
jgi:hypothetical protein